MINQFSRDNYCNEKSSYYVVAPDFDILREDYDCSVRKRTVVPKSDYQYLIHYCIAAMFKVNAKGHENFITRRVAS